MKIPLEIHVCHWWSNKNFSCQGLKEFNEKINKMMSKKWQASFVNMTYAGWSQSSQIKCVNVKPSYTENSVR